MISEARKNGVTILFMENETLRTGIVPEFGGKFISIYHKPLRNEFLWHNQELELGQRQPGDDYELNFWGGIDELIPNDIPETVDGLQYPDHGELWTTPLDYRIEDKQVILSGLLPVSGLFYQKSITLSDEKPEIITRYTIRNTSSQTRHFLWKLHAALRISAGDRLSTTAQKGRTVYPESSRFSSMQEFPWPELEGTDVSIVPPQNGSMDFFYLYEAKEGSMSMLSAQDSLRFGYQYDQTVFPYQWYFASYGQFRNHYTAILEPASAMPFSVPEAAASRQCSVLQPGEEINTTVTIYAGQNS